MAANTPIPTAPIARALELEEQGADIIDIGAESTKPGSARISAAEEMRRLIPVLKRLKDKLTVPISVDTYKAEVAERALELGVEIINDPSGLTFEPQLARTVSNFDGGLIMNHMRGRPETWAKWLPCRIRWRPSAAIWKPPSAARGWWESINRKLVIDPGLGFGKRKEQNSVIIANLGRLTGSSCRSWWALRASTSSRRRIRRRPNGLRPPP